MRHILRTMLIASALVVTLGVSLTGCETLNALSGVDAGARRAAKVAFTAYTDFVQPAILTYGQLPDCTPANPALKICKSHARWQDIKALEAKATTSVQAAGAVIQAASGDQGQIDQAITDIQAVQAAFTAAKKETGS